MTPPLDELYFIWLAQLVEDPDSDVTHERLLKQLFSKEFVWFVANDDNRLEDGKDLRIEFLRETDVGAVDEEWMQLGCSFLELMVGLSRRLAFQAEGEPRYWFWELMHNIDLDRYVDSRRYMRLRVDAITETVIFRNYKPDGQGGFFPLRNPDRDQRGVELWYQLGEYVLERE